LVVKREKFVEKQKKICVKTGDPFTDISKSDYYLELIFGIGLKNSLQILKCKYFSLKPYIFIKLPVEI
jgi:hypothetical protein